MKKVTAAALATAMMFGCVACGQQEPPQTEPQLSQMKAICELAVMDCYYHNVAKYREDDAEGVFLWKKDKKFWIEYSGVVQLGIDVSQVDMSVEGDVVTITIPPATVQSCRVDSNSLNEDSFIVDKNSAAIDADDETKAFGDAQRLMEEDAKNDQALLAKAQQRAQSLLEEYIKNIGQAMGTTYSIEWNYLDTTSSESTEPAKAEQTVGEEEVKEKQKTETTEGT